jgi:hypothetical protein
MATAKKATTKKPATKNAEPKAEPQGPQVEGFAVVDYEGLDMLDCERCEFNTFDVGSAKAHAHVHQRAESAEQERADLTEHLTETAQVTEAPDEQG